MKTKPNILFLCTGNSCRSQIAEGLMKHLSMNRFNVPPLFPLLLHLVLGAAACPHRSQS